MPHELDNKLREICTPQEILRIYIQYKKAKLDRLLSRSVPTYVESETAGGRSNRNRALSVIEVMSLPDYIANFPAWDTKKDRHGNERKIIRIPMGSDGVNYRMFEKDMERNVNEIASRIQSGKYLFRPLRDVVSLKPKYDDGTRLTKQELLLAQKDGRTRTLTIATIRDAIVQRLLHKVLGEYLEKRFFSRLDYPYPVSFAYRPGKSAVRAAQMVLKHVNEGFSHVLDADLSRFFDSIPRDALINRCSQVLGDNPLTFSLLRRFICIDRVDYFSYHWAGNSKGERIGEKIFQMQKSENYDFDCNTGPDPNRPYRYRPDSGIPQGGVISGLLSNLYLHYFDDWVINELPREFESKFIRSVSLRYVRYADDFVILARSEDDLLLLYDIVKQKLEGTVDAGGFGLIMHPLETSENAKTRYLDASKKAVTFVGFEIKNDKLRVSAQNVKRFMKRWKDSVRKLAADFRDANYIDKYPNSEERLKVFIKRYLRYKLTGYLDTKICPKCKTGYVPVYRGWIAFFAAVTDWRQIRALDKWMRKQIYEELGNDLPSLDHELLTRCGLPSLLRHYKRLQKSGSECWVCRERESSQLLAKQTRDYSNQVDIDSECVQVVTEW